MSLRGEYPISTKKGLVALTAAILTKPMTEVTMPLAITILQSGRPKFSTLVASLLRCPRILNPRMIIARPSGTKPDSLLRSGHHFLKYDLNRLSSETTRKKPIAFVTKWETPSKKKNYLQYELRCKMRLRRMTYAWCLNGHNQHYPTCCNNGEESNNVEDANDVENNVTLATALLLVNYSIDPEHFEKR